MTRGFQLPDRPYLPAIFERLAIDESDRHEVLAAWPSPETDPETWRSLRRAYHTLVADMGGYAPLQLPGPVTESTPLGRYFFVYVYLAALADVRRFHLQRGIPDDISWATLSDLGRNLKRDRLLLGDGGLRTSGWLTLHFRGSIYQLGRLQFNRVNIRAAHVADAFREGEPTLCTSWLLDPQLAEYLAPDSNIVRFGRRFTLVGDGYDGDADVLRFVFHRIAPRIDDLPQRTTLERAIVAHLRAGSHWRNRTGWVEL
ncbi:MAG: hypothetical protein E6H89_11275 [Chloroflexi bacterium]|nr:MAG: hypothetical protein E6H89_11275 [Chloroflexota bacterium]